MTATPPEAMREYSRAPGPARGWQAAVPPLLAACALTGAALLFLSEFTTLFTIHASNHRGALQSTRGSSHNAWAFVPIALMGAILAVALLRSASRAPLVALLGLGVVALLIAVLGDLPDAQASGVFSRRFLLARASPSTGMYLETLGAVLMIAAAGTGLLLSAPSLPRRRSVPAASSF
jgi:hypothetical protein